MDESKRWEIQHSEEYKAYIDALCRLACVYISSIRRQFAAKAFELYGNETVRRLVLAYGEEIKKLEADRLREFKFAADHADTEWSLEDSCLNNAAHYEAAIKLFFLEK